MPGTIDTHRVIVCNYCLQATCWQGKFFCDRFQTAGTVEKTVAELVELGLEHPSYWSASTCDNMPARDGWPGPQALA
jgi:hypothetical protein